MKASISMRALGIDPGTKSFDLCCIEDDVDKVVLDTSISSDVVAVNPSKVLNMILEANADVIVGPSGYGLEFKHISQFTPEDVALTTLDKMGDVEIPVLSGLRRLLLMMKDAKLNAYSLPGVIHLPTVPLHRKMNKIDMGTADKTCVAAFAVWDQAREYGIDYAETSLICVEMGFGYNAAIAVEDGRVIDGIGGTIFPGPGYLTLSLMDGELAYLLGGFSKLRLFQGGATFIAANQVMELDEFVKKVDEEEAFKVAWNAMVDGIVKAVSMAMTSFEKRPREIILTGRISRIKGLYGKLEKELGDKFNLPIRRPTSFTKAAKDVAQGSALIANGIADGKYRGLVEVMKIKEAKGTVLDYIHLSGFSINDTLKLLRRS
jgi:predicted butyrate kinase (DUF1464 family)